MKKNVFLSVAAASAIAAIATGLALPAFSQPIPEDSASMFRKQQGKAPLPPTSGTTVFYSPRPREDPPSPNPNISWSMYFKGAQKCSPSFGCATIGADGYISGFSYGPVAPVSINPVTLGTVAWVWFDQSQGCNMPATYGITARPIVQPSTGNYTDWTVEETLLGIGGGCFGGL